MLMGRTSVVWIFHHKMEDSLYDYWHPFVGHIKLFILVITIKDKISTRVSLKRKKNYVFSLAKLSKLTHTHYRPFFCLRALYIIIKYHSNIKITWITSKMDE